MKLKTPLTRELYMDVSMDTSMLLARLFGVVLIVANLGFLLNRKFYHAVLKEFSQNSFDTYLSGFINLLLGLLIVSFHNVWEDWMGLVTFLGWVLLVSGACRILFPKMSMRMAAKCVEGKRHMHVTIVLVVLLLVGIFLAYCGFSSAPVMGS